MLERWIIIIIWCSSQSISIFCFRCKNKMAIQLRINIPRINNIYNNNYASTIRRNILRCGEWQKHNYFDKYYLCEAGWLLLQRLIIITTKRIYRNGLNAAPDIMILQIFPALSQIFKKCDEKRQKHSAHQTNKTSHCQHQTR